MKRATDTQHSAPILTIDLEEWFHLLDVHGADDASGWSQRESRVEANTERILQLLGRHGVQATFFTLGWIAARHPTLLRRIAGAGHQVACHSHVHSLVHRQSPAEFRDETSRALDAISRAVALPVDCYRAPGFSITASCLWAFDVMHDLGVRTDCSVYSGNHAHGGLGQRFPATPFRIQLERGTLRAFPVSVRRLGPVQVALAGGGYFRLLPLAVVAHWTHRSPYVMSYFHPRDFDPGQPRLPGLSLGRRFKSYVGLGGALAKFDAFLERFGGRSVAQAERAMEWDRAPLVTLGREPPEGATQPPRGQDDRT